MRRRVGRRRNRLSRARRRVAGESRPDRTLGGIAGVPYDAASRAPMISHLTSRPREGILFGTVAGRTIRLATLRNQPALQMETWRQAAQSGTRITGWPKLQEIRTGKAAGPVQHSLTVGENAAL